MRQPRDNEASPVVNDVRQGLFGRAFAWLFSQRHFHFKLLSGTAAGVLVIVLLAGAFLYVTIRNHSQDGLRAHTIEVIRLSGLIENDIASLETGHRGFLLTGDKNNLVPFDRLQDLIQRRLDALSTYISDRPEQRKRVMKVKEIVQNWLNTVAKPQIQTRTTGPAPAAGSAAFPLGNSILDQARDILQSLQDEEQITLNQRMVEQEWASQSTQILDFLPKLERSVLEMEKEKRGYLLTNEISFAEAYKRAITDYYTYNGYLSILIASTPSQAQLLAELRSKVEIWINNSGVAGTTTKNATPNAVPNPSADKNEALMADIKQMLGTFEKNEVAIYDMRTAAASRERIIKTSVLGVLALLSVALLVASNSYSFVMVRRQLSKLRRSRNAYPFDY